MIRELADRIRSLKGAGPLIVSVDGRCGAGKTTLAESLHGLLEKSVVVHGDDFFLRDEQLHRRQVPGENIDYERLIQEVLGPVRSGQDFVYRKFDCKSRSLDEGMVTACPEILLLEGSYSQNVHLAPYSDFRIFVDCDRETQKARICGRSPEKWEAFHTCWIPLEETYFKRFNIKERADVRVCTSGKG